MMSNLFSIFDPSTNSFINLNWLSFFLFIFMMPNNFWLIPSLYNNFIFKSTNLIMNEFKSLMSNFMLNMLIFLSLMMLILHLNFLSLFPYIFNPTSHMSINLPLSIPIWLAMMIFGWSKFYNHMFIHLLPMNTPSLLIPFMILIESLSNLIRPLTLSIRLTANMIAGHLLLCLIGQSFSNLYLMSMLFLLLIQTLLMILEISVSIIQSYVFSILLLMYSKEIM